ncbi:MAG: shikimate dehydrogenase [Methylococcaceae bacterium]|nr:shikimate dehydrogenase [Methylococcaceae bacterium]MCI0732951.1 shikimate dehydrogenase [Methylococcaceae bacterium]
MPDHDQYAVFGHPINHSKSPLIHRLFAEQTGQTRVKYEASDVPAEQFEARVQEFIARGGMGLNCTLPLKELAFHIAAETSSRAAQCKAVNTLVVREDGSLFGDNTDGLGLVRDLTNNLKLAIEGLDILLLGAGGAGRGILGPILECNPGSVFVANRTAEKARDLADDFDQFKRLCAGGLDELEGRRFDLILNATAASLRDDLPELPNKILNPNAVCYDLAYASKPTAFVKWARLHNASISVDGIGMLVEQAAEAFRIWCGVLPDTRPVIKMLQNERTV